jgi:hypothetical protein
MVVNVWHPGLVHSPVEGSPGQVLQFEELLTAL